MKQFYKLVLILTLVSFHVASAANPVKKTEAGKKSETVKTNEKSKTQDAEIVLEPPPLEKNEYAIFIEDKYLKFTTKKFQDLELDMSCFKTKTPKCEAFEFSEIKPKSLIMKNEALNNLAAIFCEAVHGRNLLALDRGRNEYNFCRFQDGSMVNSWSLYYKHFPKKQ